MQMLQKSEMLIYSTFGHLAEKNMTSGFSKKFSLWWKLLLSYMLSAPHDEAFSYYSHISSSGYQIHGRRGWVMAVIRPESFFLNPCSSTFWGPFRTLCSPLSQPCPEWKINNTPWDGSGFNKDLDLEECHVFTPDLGCFPYLLIQHRAVWEEFKLTAVHMLNTSALCLHWALPIIYSTVQPPRPPADNCTFSFSSFFFFPFSNWCWRFSVILRLCFVRSTARRFCHSGRIWSLLRQIETQAYLQRSAADSRKVGCLQRVGGCLLQFSNALLCWLRLDQAAHVHTHTPPGGSPVPAKSPRVQDGDVANMIYLANQNGYWKRQIQTRQDTHQNGLQQQHVGRCDVTLSINSILMIFWPLPFFNGKIWCFNHLRSQLSCQPI